MRIKFPRGLGIAGTAVLATGLAFAGVTAAGAAPGTAGTIPTGAVQELDFCTQESIIVGTSGWESNSSEEVTLPFSVNLLGETHDSLYVNSAGSLSFEEPWWSGEFWETGNQLRSNAAPVSAIVPLSGDFTTSHIDPAETSSYGKTATYGTSADGSAFCASWTDVARMGNNGLDQDQLYSFQAIIRDRSNLPGGKPGDADVTFNYDQLPAFEQRGFDGETMRGGARVGLLSQSKGWLLQLPGSGIVGADPVTGGRIAAVLDGQPQALTSGSLNSLNQLGRYTLNLRDGKTGDWTGELSGTVTDVAGDPVAGAIVSAGGNVVTTAADGHYWFGGLFGQVQIIVNPPNGSTMLQGHASADVPESGSVVKDIVLKTGPTPIPPGTTVTQHDAEVTTSMGFGSPFTVTHDACVAADSVTLTVVQGGIHAFTGSLVEGAPGKYSITVPALMPVHGAAEFLISVNCSDGTTQNVPFDLYLDPSGTILDTEGNPVSDATVTLLRADAPEGPFVTVEDGSAIMSPSNRANPSVTAEDGVFAWDVLEGYYIVEASAAGCVVPGSTDTVVSTAVLPVPPEQFDLELVLECERAVIPPTADEAAITLSATEVEQGGRITVSGANFADAEAVEIWLHSDPVKLATATAATGGAFAQQVTIPATTPVGTHTVRIERAGAPAVTAQLLVKEATTAQIPGTDSTDNSGQGLAVTGTELTLLIAFAVALAAAGVILVASRRRRATR